MLLLDTVNDTWTALKPTGSAPSARGGHSVSAQPRAAPPAAAVPAMHHPWLSCVIPMNLLSMPTQQREEFLLLCDQNACLADESGGGCLIRRR